MKVNQLKILLVSLILGLACNVKAQRMDQDLEFQIAFREATKNYMFGKYVPAVNLYKECLRLKPQSSATHYQLSKMYLTTGNVPLARLHAKKAVEYESSNKWFLQTLGDIYQYEQNFDSAVICYLELLELEPANLNTLFAIASLYERLKNVDEALRYLEMVDERIGKSKETSMVRYRIYDSQNMPEKAISELKAASILSPDEYQLAGMIAEFYQRNNMTDSARVYYEEIFPEYQADPTVVFSYANFLLETGRVDSARILLLNVMNDRFTDQNTKSGYFLNVLGDDESFTKALPVIDTVTRAYIKYNQTDIRSLSVFADVFLRLRKYNDATWALKKIVEKDPSNYPATEQLIYTLNFLGKPDSVLLFANRAMRMNEERPVIYLFSGSAYYQKKDYSAAVRDLQKGLSLTDDNAMKLEFYSLLAECYQQEGLYQESELAFKAALEIDKDNMAVLNNFAYYLSLREKNLREALKMSRATINSEPENPTYLDTYAWILFKKGKTEKAKKFILQAINNGGQNNEEIMSHTAEIHIKLGEYAEAVKYLEKIIQMPDQTKASKARERIKEINSLKNIR